jgi:hypothetical protein
LWKEEKGGVIRYWRPRLDTAILRQLGEDPAFLPSAGERAESAYFSQDAYSKAAQPKKLFIVPGATHVDLYDRPQYVGQAIEKLTKFYGQYLT